jgi:hypothetical protein
VNPATSSPADDVHHYVIPPKVAIDSLYGLYGAMTFQTDFLMSHEKGVNETAKELSFETLSIIRVMFKLRISVLHKLRGQSKTTFLYMYMYISSIVYLQVVTKNRPTLY